MALSKKTEGFALEYHGEFSDNDTSLLPRKERNVLAKIEASMIFPNTQVCNVDFNFDHKEGDSRLACMVMDDWGAELIADSYSYRYGE